MANWYLINGWQLNELKHSANKTQFDILEYVVDHNHIGNEETIEEIKAKFKESIDK